MLEEATRKIREQVQLETSAIEEVQAQIEPLQTECDTLFTSLEAQKSKWHAADQAAKDAAEADIKSCKQLKDQLEELQHREEGLETERARYEGEVLPDLRNRLAFLEAELKRMDEFPAASNSSGNNSFFAQPEARSRTSSFRLRGLSKKAMPIQAQQQYLESYFASSAPAPIPQMHPYPYALMGDSSIPAEQIQERSRRSSDAPSKPARKTSDATSTQRIVPGLPSFRSSQKNGNSVQNQTAPSESPKFLSGFRKKPINPAQVPSSPPCGWRWLKMNPYLDLNAQ